MSDFTRLARSLRDLPPLDARTCLGVRRFVCKTLAVAQPWPLCVVGVSGGVDSSALALIMHLLGMPLVFAHLDHGLRPESADDAQHVAAFAASLGVPCELERVDVAEQARMHTMGLEEAGRMCRYTLFERVRKQYGAAWILTGHHLDDLEEDVLLRLIRGGGWPALGGMKGRDEARHLLRPLLHSPRSSLEALARAAHLPWREDVSNGEGLYRRNRVRHELLPLIRAENPAFGQSVRRLWEQARLDADYWDTCIGPVEELSAVPFSSLSPSPFSAPSVAHLFLSRERLDALHPAARQRLYLATVRVLCTNSQGGQARADALHKLDALWQARRSGARVQMPGLEAVIEREGILFVVCGEQ